MICRNFHNNLRITRILKCLGLLGYEYLKEPLLRFFVTEIIKEKTLTPCKRSCMDFWIPTLAVQEKCDELHKLAYSLGQPPQDSDKLN